MQEQDEKPNNLQDLPIYDLSRCACHSSPVWLKEDVESLLRDRIKELEKTLGYAIEDHGNHPSDITFGIAELKRLLEDSTDKK